MERREPSYTVGGTATVESGAEASLKTKNTITIRSCNPTPGHVSGKDKNPNLKRYVYPTFTEHHLQQPNVEAT